MVNVLLAILVLSIIVIVHEFGHFVIAKANGISVVEFSIGFGPKLLHYKKGETEYCIKMLPFGGACVMLGDEFLELNYGTDSEDEDETDDEEREKRTARLALENGYDLNKTFSCKSVWARIATIAAGPVFNFILAFVFAVMIISSIGYDPCIVDVIEEKSPATQAGLMVGDRIVGINGKRVSFYRDFYFYRYYHMDKDLNLTVVRDGKKLDITVVPEHRIEEKYQIGIMISQNCRLDSVTKDSPAMEAGLKAKDIVKKVNNKTVSDNSEITQAITESNGKVLEFVVLRDGKEVTVKVTPKKVELENYYTGFTSYGDRVKVSPMKSLLYSFEEVGYEVRSVVDSLGMLISGKGGVTMDDLMGPVGTVSTMSEIVEESRADGTFYVFLNLCNLGALISANLGVMNLLPIPALDGGRLVFLIIEAIRGKPVKKEHEGIVHFIGMILLILLMGYVLIKDIKGLF